MREGGGGLINFPPLKRGGGGLLERGGLIEDLRYGSLPFPRGTYSKATS